MNFVEESLRQNLFWLRIMKEHALFIRLGLPCDREGLIVEARDLEELFGELLEKARNLINPSPDIMRQFNSKVINALNRIIAFKTDILNELITCRLGGSNFPLLIDHIRREAIRFRMILIRLQNDIELLPAQEALQEEIFWLRIMGDHAHFIAHLLDPSERNFVSQALDFAERFETLRLQARDLESVEAPKTFENWLLPEYFLGQPVPQSIGVGLPNSFVTPRLRFFNSQVKDAVKEIRNFKQSGLNLVKNCTVLSIIPPLLADHILREAEMALQDLSIVEQRLKVSDCALN